LKAISLRKYILAGMVVWLPIIVTFVILRFIIDLLDQTISLIPRAYQPEILLGTNIPGLGVILSLFLLVITGIIATNIIGQRLFVWSESILAKIPLVRTIYNTSKQVIQAMFSPNSKAFRKVLLVEYPRKGIYSIGFQTGVTTSSVREHIGKDLVSIFIPTTPNPTAGFIMMFPQSEVIELSMSVDEALKFIISLGMMQPAEKA